MDVNTPSTSGACCSPPKRRKDLDAGYLSIAEKQTIINMYKKLLNEEPKLKTVSIVSKIVASVGVAKSTVYRTVKEYKSTGSIASSEHHGGRPSTIKTFDEHVRNSVRRIVHSFFFKNELPTLDKIMNELKHREDLPQMSRSTLFTFMKEINFKYLKRNRRSILIERDDIVRWRINYLKSIKQYRKEGRPIYYLDETWVNEGHTMEKVWIDTSIKSNRDAFVKGLSSGLKNPSGKGKRLIVLHAGSEEGFVEDALLLFEGKKTGDYHEEMNADVFEKWFAAFLNKIPENSVIVMDNAPYHSRKLEKIPTTSTKKTDMQEWLRSKNIVFQTEMVRSELLYLIKQNKEKYNLYVTDEMAKKFNKTVLRLPPYHCELNPIELIWAQVKSQVAAKNTTFKIKEVKELLIQALNDVSTTDWLKCIGHILKEEESMGKLDERIDAVIEPIIISLGGDDDEESEED